MALPNGLLTGAEYLPLERQATEGRSELIDGHVVAMAGASFVNSQILGNLFRQLDRQMRPAGCTVATQDLRVQVDDQNYLYPDLVGVCAEPQFADGFSDTLVNPVLIV